MHKRILSLLLVLAMVVSMMPTAFAANPGGGTITAGTDTVLEVGKTYRLVVEGLTGTDQAELVYGTDYQVESASAWQASNGDTWGEAVGAFDESDGSLTVTPTAEGTQYRVTVHFIGNFAGNDPLTLTYGVSAGGTDPEPVQRQQSQTTLTVTDAADQEVDADPVKEYETLTLLAEVENADGTAAADGGSVTFYAGGRALATVPVIVQSTSATAAVSYTVPAYQVDGLTLEAHYQGSSTYAASSDSKTISISSVTLDGSGVSLQAAPALTAGVESTLSLADAVKDTAGRTMTQNKDYTVVYYENKGNGLWLPVTGAAVTPAADGYAYMARILPAGEYTQGGFETDPIGDVQRQDPGASDLQTDAAELWQGQAAVYTASFENAAGGSVDFYYEKDGVKVFAGTVPLVDTAASCAIIFPEAGTYVVSAVYSGSSLYNGAEASVADQAVQSTTLDATATVTGTLALGEDCELSLTVQANGGDTYDADDYIVVWEQNDGSGWAEFQRGGERATVRPDSNDWSYRVVLYPAGDYKEPANGIVSAPITAAGAARIQTLLALSAENETPFEDRTITLTAAITDGDGQKVSGGYVTFTMPDGTEADVAVDVTGTAVLTLPAPAYGAAEVYKAQYMGDGVLYRESAEETLEITSRSIQIVTSGGLEILDEKTDAAYTAVAGETATLKLPDLYEQGQQTALQYGEDYTVTWYVCTDEVTWQLLGTGETMEVKPEKNTDQYKAVAMPAGDYKKPVDGVIFLTTKGELVVTKMELTREPTGTVYVGNTVTVTATVQQAADDEAVPAGNVYFIDAATGAQLAVQPLDQNGQASYRFKVESIDPVSIRAEYAGTGKYAPCQSEQDLSFTPSAATIQAASDQLIVTGELDAGGKLKVGTTYTLTLPEIQDAADAAQVLELNKHYTVVWMSRNEDGSWSRLEVEGNAGNSIQVTPGHENAAYTAVVYPRYAEADNSYYTEPRGGIAMQTLTVGTKLESTITISASSTEVFEATDVTLKAVVKQDQNNIAGGSVTFYRDAEAIGTVAVVNGEATMELTMPAWNGTDDVYDFTAQYNGTEAYTEATTADGVEVTVRSASLTVNGGTITIENLAGNPVVNTAYTLNAPAVYAKDDLTHALTIDRDYTMEWQYAQDGNTWQTVTGTAATLTDAVFENTSAAYRVVIRPAAGANYTMPSSIVVELKPSTTAEPTITELTADKDTYFESEQVILTAKVTGENTGAFANGTVKFYKGTDNSGEYLGYADLTTQGEAVLITTAPDYESGSTVTYYAEYVGNAIYGASFDTVVIHIQSAKIVTKDNSTQITVTPDDDPLIVNHTYTLTIPAVYQQGADQADPAKALQSGLDYSVQWQVSYDGGELWQNVGNTGDTVTVTPEQKNAQYRAIITPAGNFKQAVDADGQTVNALVMQNVASQVIGTTTQVAAVTTAAMEEGIKTEYEGKQITVIATVKDDNGDLVSSGYVTFYRNGEQLNAVPVDVKDGVAQWTTEMSAYDTDKSLAENQDILTAKYAANDSYGASEDAAGVAVRIRSTSIAEPVIQAAYNATQEDTSSGAITGMPAGTQIAFSLSGEVKALDGRTLDRAEYTLQWYQNSNNGMFVPVSGAIDDPYSIKSGAEGDSFKLELVPAADGNMKKGAFSKTATVGTLADPQVSIGVQTPFADGTFHADVADKTSGSHYGDEITLQATVTGANATPTGVVSFWYKLANGEEKQLGDYQTLAQTPAPNDGNTAAASFTTDQLPQGVMEIYVKYHGDKTFQAEEETRDAAAAKQYKVWSTQIHNADGFDGALKITASDATGDVQTLTAGQAYTLTLADTVYTTDGEKLTLNGTYTVEWQQSTNGVDWTKVEGAESSLSCQVKPATAEYQYRAKIMTTADLFAEPDDAKRLDTEYTNVIGAGKQTVAVNLSTSKGTLAAPYTDAVYAGNEITLYAEIVPSANYTVDPTGTVKFYYVLPNADGTYGQTLQKVVPSDPALGGSNEATITKRDGKFYAAITTASLPDTAANKMQMLAIVAEYSGDGAYDALQSAVVSDAEQKSPTQPVTVYSSTVYVNDQVQNRVLDQKIDVQLQETRGVVIYAPENTLVSDGSSTTLTLKPLYTLDAERADGLGLVQKPGDYTTLAADVNYTVQWQYTTSLDTTDVEGSNWLSLTSVGHTAQVQPQAGYAYRAKISVNTSQERTKESNVTYYSNILVAAGADATLQIQVTPSSSGAYADTDILVDAYVFGGSNVPAGDITMGIYSVDDDANPILTRANVTAVNGHARFGDTDPDSPTSDPEGAIHLEPGIYNVKVTYSGNSGYTDSASTSQYIVRYRTDEVAVAIDETTVQNLVYNGFGQRVADGIVTFNGADGFAQAQTLAEESMVFSYEKKDGENWIPVDTPQDAGTYRVMATLPQSIYYQAQTSAWVEFQVAPKPIRIESVLFQDKIYDGAATAALADVQLEGVVAGDSVYAVGEITADTEQALVKNQATFTATALAGPDCDNYTFAADGSLYSDPDFTIARSELTVDSSQVAGTGLTGLVVYDAYGNLLARGSDYTVRYLYHDGTGVKATTELGNAGKYTVVIAPVDAKNFKGGESFVMNVAEDKTVTFTGNDTKAETRPGVITFADVIQVYDSATGYNTVTATASNGAAVSVDYNYTPAAGKSGTDKYGRFILTATAEGCDTTYGVLTVLRADGEQIAPVVDDKIYDGQPAIVKNADAYPEGTVFIYTGGEITGMSAEAPQDAGTYTVTARVPWNDQYVAYTNTSTFTISPKEISATAVALTKQTFTTNPAWRVTYDGLVEGDSDLSMLVQPSFKLVNIQGTDDFNNVGVYTIIPSGVLSRNYVVSEYHNGTFSIQATDPALTMEIVGLPNGQIHYGDQFTVSLYGTNGKRIVNDSVLYSNSSSVIRYYIAIDPNGDLKDESNWTKDNGNVTITDEGFVSIRGAAAEDFTIVATRGTGDLKIYTTQAVDVEKRPVNIAMAGVDAKTYDGTNQAADHSMYIVTGELAGDQISSDSLVYQVVENDGVTAMADWSNAGYYLVAASYEDAKYVGNGMGLIRVWPRNATVTSQSEQAVYGDEPGYPVQNGGYISENIVAKDTSAIAVRAKTVSNVRSNSDVGTYPVFTSGMTDPNYQIRYVYGAYTVTPKALTVATAGVDGGYNRVTGQTEREYGVANPVMGYQFTDLIAGDSLADFVVNDLFVTYERKQEDDANKSGAAARGDVNGKPADYGKIDLADDFANAGAQNYTFTATDGRLDIFQKNITIDVQDLTVKIDTELTNDSYVSAINRILTEKPMEDTEADLGLQYQPVNGKAGQPGFTDGTAITVALKAGSTTLEAEDYFAQNYYCAAPQSGTLSVKTQSAAADISADKSGASVVTTAQVYLNEYVQVYTKNAESGRYEATEFYLLRTDVAGVTDGADQDGYGVAVAGKTLYTKNAETGAYVASGSSTQLDTHHVKLSDVQQTTNDRVNVGNIHYVVLASDGQKVAEGTMTADAAKKGEYAAKFAAELANGSYTIWLNPTGAYALEPTSKDFTVSGGGGSGEGGGEGGGGGTGGGGGGGATLEREKHDAYVQGDDAGNFNANQNMTRAEAATVFYNLLTNQKVDTSDIEFTDVDDAAWYAKAVKTLAALDIITGYEDGSFHPNASVSRAEFATMASRFDNLSAGTMRFTDVSDSHWAYSYIVSAATKGWINGYTDGTFRPDNNITRAEVVTMVNRVLDRTADESYIDAHVDELTSFADVTDSHWAYYNILEAANSHDYKKSSSKESWTALR